MMIYSMHSTDRLDVPNDHHTDGNASPRSYRNLLNWKTIEFRVTVPGVQGPADSCDCRPAIQRVLVVLSLVFVKASHSNDSADANRG